MNRCCLVGRGGRTKVPLDETLNSTGLQRAGWDLLPQGPPPYQQNDSNKKNDANTSKQ